MCGSVLRDGDVCRRPIGHFGSCEVTQGKRCRPSDAQKADIKLIAYRRLPRIGDAYQAVVPAWTHAADTIRPTQTCDTRENKTSTDPLR